jgi:predicted metallo-beta-lactamase superfamily hydrolase
MNKAKISENPFISQVHIAAASLGLALVKSVAELLGVRRSLLETARVTVHRRATRRRGNSIQVIGK